ncbi:uncharacterized protein LOC143052125 isoform X2 [Mytilus galloprovincialis]|uniref:uncharacterized protein LOC143052125 isoform X2 n=1 Tax=Mytilus galloprovincialis TaxID=29158 RepID=UPI003F7C54AA
MKYLYIYVVLLLVLYWKCADAVTCYSCKNLPHPADCGDIVECGAHEICRTEKVISPDGITTFNSMCFDRDQCNPLSIGLGKRQNIVGLSKRQNSAITCRHCCGTSFCNKDLCDVPKQEHGIRCLSCNDVLKPSDCKKVEICSQDSQCYTQAFRFNDETRYRLGCAPKNYCASNTTSNGTVTTPTPGNTPIPVVGKRQQSFKDIFGTPCAMGCLTEYCNRELCENGTSATGCHLLKTPSSDNCVDIDTYGCILVISVALKNGESACAMPDIRNYFCPETCGVCQSPVITQAPIVISSRPSNQNTASAAVITSVLQTTASSGIPNTTILPVVSTQLNIPGACGADHYSEDACHKVDCEIQMCNDSALKGLCPHYCNRECGHRDCYDIPGYISK